MLNFFYNLLQGGKMRGCWYNLIKGIASKGDASGRVLILKGDEAKNSEGINLVSGILKE